MTIQDLINWLSDYHFYVLVYFGTIIILSFIIPQIANQNNIKIVKYLISVLVYCATIPGILAFYLLLYNILFLKTNILKISISSYFLPILAMILTIIILSRKVRMRELPGFSKLSNLFLIISITFGIIFILNRTYFGVIILGSIFNTLIVFAILMIILHFSWSKLVK